MVNKADQTPDFVAPEFADPDFEPETVQEDVPPDVAPWKPTMKSRSVVEMKLRGANFAEIAQILEYDDVSDVVTAFTRTLAYLAGTQESYLALQQQTAMQYDLMLKSLAEKALSPWISDPNDDNPDKAKRRKIANPEHIAYLREFRATVQAKEALLGLKAPTRIQIDSPDAEKMDQVVQAVIATQRGELPPGGNIFGLEEILYEPDADGVFRTPAQREEREEEQRLARLETERLAAEGDTHD